MAATITAAAPKAIHLSFDVERGGASVSVGSRETAFRRAIRRVSSSAASCNAAFATAAISSSTELRSMTAGSGNGVATPGERACGAP
jgi:hypothetical protein